MSKVVLSILVNNTSGVLSRVAGLFSRRGYNIDSLTVGETENPAFSRMTVSVTGDDIVLEQIEKQVNKLEDVKSVKQLTGEASVCRELILVKVEADKDARPAINAIVDIFRAKIVDVADNSMMIELTGNQAKLDAFIKLIEGYEIKELVKSTSTITQQLLRNQVIWKGNGSSVYEKITRKIQEQYLAVQLEQKLDKEQILEYYLNTINLGGCKYVRSKDLLPG